VRGGAAGEVDLPFLVLPAGGAEGTGRGERVELLLVLEPDLVEVRDDEALAASRNSSMAGPAKPALRLDGGAGGTEGPVQICGQGADVASRGLDESAGSSVGACLDLGAKSFDRGADRADSLLRARASIGECIHESEPSGRRLCLRGGALRKDAELGVFSEAA
jgi:hypothetical protein